MVVDVQVRNVVCSYALPFHIDLRRVALNCGNVTYDRSRGVLYKQKRNPSCYVKVHSSGNVYIVGCRSEDECRMAARGVGRMIQKVMDKATAPVRLRDYRICNILATCKFPFGVKVEEMAKKYPKAGYEPELSVGLTWNFEEPKACLRIHTTGSVTVTGATSVDGVMRAIDLISPIVSEFSCAPRQTGKKRRPPRAPSPSTTVIAKQPRKTAPVYDPACSEFFEERMHFQDEEEFYEENGC